jgi:hypothetical protein
MNDMVVAILIAGVMVIEAILFTGAWRTRNAPP